jgi:DNA-binding NarL/FixJ family response regulator
VRTTVPVVAIFNSSDDVSEMLRDLLEREGLVVVSARVDDVRRARSDVRAFMEQHDPLVVVYDLIPPFARQWQFLTHLRQTPDFERRAFVLTSANAAAAQKDGGHNERIIELLGRQSDLEAIVNAVKMAVAASATASPPGT